MLGLSPLRAGLALLPGTAVLFAVSALSAPVTVRFARGLVLSVGLLLVGGGVALMLLVGPHSSWTALLPGLILACAGTGLVNPAQAALALSSGRPQESGLLSGAANTFRNGGTAVGVAVFGALIPTAAALGQGSPAEYVTGLHHALLVGSAVSLAGAVGVAVLIGLRAPRAAAR